MPSKGMRKEMGDRELPHGDLGRSQRDVGAAAGGQVAPDPQRTNGDRIPLHNRRGEVVGYALVDAEDYEWLMRWRWSLSPRGYAYRKTTVFMVQVELKMHRVLMNTPPDLVDHINGDPLDNRRSNLRLASNAENGQNRDPRGQGTSGYRGVSFQRDIGRWRAQHTLNRKKHHIGTFDTAEEAAAAAAAWRAEHMPYASEVARAQ